MLLPEGLPGHFYRDWVFKNSVVKIRKANGMVRARVWFKADGRTYAISPGDRIPVMEKPAEDMFCRL